MADADAAPATTETDNPTSDGAAVDGAGEDENATPEKKYIPATKEEHFENDKPKEGIKFYKKNESGDGVDNPPVEVTDPVIAEVDTYMVEAPETGKTEGGGDERETEEIVDEIFKDVKKIKPEITDEMLQKAAEKLKKVSADGKVEGADKGGRRRTKRKGRKGSRKGSRKSRKGAKKGAKKSKKSGQSSQSQNGGRRSRKNRRKYSHRRKH